MAAVVYGYCRISTQKQNIERQVRNIKAVYPEAIIIKEAYTGTKLSRKEFDKILSKVKKGDIIVFDEVSRFARNSAEGVLLYKALYKEEIELVFLKQRHIDTAVYKKAMQNRIALTGDKVDIILEAINEYLMALAEEQIKIAFDQAEKEVTDLHQRTREGIQTARLNGKQIGREKGRKYETKKAKASKEIIRDRNKTFGGPLNDAETIAVCGISLPSLYKYKREIWATLRKETEND